MKVGKNKVDKPYSQVLEICLDEMLSVEGAATPVATRCVPPAACDRGDALLQRQCPSPADPWSGFVPWCAHMPPEEEWEWVQVDVVEEKGKEKVKEKEKEKEEEPEKLVSPVNWERLRGGPLTQQEAARAKAMELGRVVRALLFPGRLKRKRIAYELSYDLLKVCNANSKVVGRLDKVSGQVGGVGSLKVKKVSGEEVSLQNIFQVYGMEKEAGQLVTDAAVTGGLFVFGEGKEKENLRVTEKEKGQLVTDAAVTGGLFVFGEGKEKENLRVMEKEKEKDFSAGDFGDEDSVTDSEIFFKGGLVAQVGQAPSHPSLKEFTSCTNC